jgi:putative SOS response-associated peptidase YedK
MTVRAQPHEGYSPTENHLQSLPVILDPDAYDLGLDPGMRTASAVCDRLKPYDTRVMQCYPVSSRINHVVNDDVVNDDEECSRPVVVAQIRKQLFA